MRIAFDIGGVITKYPNEFRVMARTFHESGHDVFVITDMHKRDEVLAMLSDNGFGFIPQEQVFSADYIGVGEFCKAVLLKTLRVDVFVDDFGGYVQWDSTLGPAPIRLLVSPDGFRPYWHDSWKTTGQEDFGRRVTSLEVLKKAE
jgi:hypothetical protein